MKKTVQDPEAPEAGDGAPQPEKKPWSKPTIRLGDGILHTDSGLDPSPVGENADYRPTS